mgnify:CR=1 FL=1
MSYRGAGTIRGPLRFEGTPSPGLSVAGEGRIYFDSASNKFKVSENGGAYVDLTGGASSGGWTDDGTVVRLTTVTDQVGIGTATPGAANKLEVDASAGGYAQAAVFLNGNVGVGTATPTSRLHTFGSFGMKVRSVSTNSVAGNEAVISVDASGGDVTITLPTATTITDRTYYIKKIDSTTNTVFVQAFGAQTIDGLNLQALSIQYESMQIVSDGAGWLKI